MERPFYSGCFKWRCVECKREYASGFNLKRHCEAFHGYTVGVNGREKVRKHPEDAESINRDNGKKTEETESEEQLKLKNDESKESNNQPVPAQKQQNDKSFWRYLISEVIDNMREEQKNDNLEYLEKAEDMLDEPRLSSFIDRLKERVEEMKEFARAADSDPIMQRIAAKERNMKGKPYAAGFSHENLFEIAWDKALSLIKAKIKLHCHEFERLEKSYKSEEDEETDQEDAHE